MNLRIAIALLFLTVSASADEPLAPLQFMVGEWRGTSRGEPGEGTVHRVCERVLRDRFIECRTTVTYEKEVHVDRALFSYDKGAKKLRLRQFHGEGFVNTYEGEGLVFTTTAIAGVHNDMDEAQRKLLRARILLARSDTIAVHRRYDRVSLRAEAFAECRAAVALVQQALKEDGDRAATELELRILGRAYLTCEAASETSAETVLKQLIALPSRLAATEATIGLLQMKAKNYSAAIHAFDVSVARDSMDIDHRLLLAEALLRAGDLDRAETEIRYVLNRAPENVDARVMLGRLFIEHGDKGDVDAYAQAVTELTTAERIDGTISASKKMTPRELGNLYYHRGFARTKLYDDQKTVKDESVLVAAAQDFQNCEMNDPENHRAAAARRKVNDRLNPRTRGWISDRAAGLVCTILSLGVFFVALTDYVADDLGAGYASLLIFGSLLFLIARFYLPQLLKLKVGTVELEKSSLESSLARVPLQIRKAAVG